MALGFFFKFNEKFCFLVTHNPLQVQNDTMKQGDSGEVAINMKEFQLVSCWWMLRSVFHEFTEIEKPEDSDKTL